MIPIWCRGTRGRSGVSRRRGWVRNCARWRIVETPRRLETLRKIIDFQRRLVTSGAFIDPRSHIYYLPELYCAYFGRSYAAFSALPHVAREAIDPDGAFAFMRGRVLAYVQEELMVAELNVFDAALVLIALGNLGQERPYLRRLHRHVRIVQQPIKFVEFPGVVGVRHSNLSNCVHGATKPQNRGGLAAVLWIWSA